MKTEDGFFASCLSSDGSLLAASADYVIYVWKYNSEQACYTMWEQGVYWHGSSKDEREGLQFSPTLLPILMFAPSIVEVWNLGHYAHDTREYYHLDAISGDRAYIVTSPGDQTITITNLSKCSSQFIYTGCRVYGLALTGNTLLVHGYSEVAAWQLTGEGMVDGVLDNQVADHNHRIWTKPIPEDSVKFWAEGDVGVIMVSKDLIYYDTGTGKELESVSVQVPPSSELSFWQYLDNHGGDCCHHTPYDTLPGHLIDEYHCYSKAYPPTSIAWHEGGWVKYVEGEHHHKFWLPNHWNPNHNAVCWYDSITTLQFPNEDPPVTILFKF